MKSTQIEVKPQNSKAILSKKRKIKKYEKILPLSYSDFFDKDKKSISEKVIKEEKKEVNNSMCCVIS